MTTPLNPLLPENDSPDETPEALAGIAERMQRAIEELFAVKAEAEELSKTAKLPDEVERVLTAASQLNSQQPAVDRGAALTELFDRRLYLPCPEGWTLRVKTGPREYCCYRNPGEEWFHLLVDGELFLQLGQEKVCLNCAYRQGILTDDRLFWQTGRRRHRIQHIDDAGNADEVPPT